MTVEPWKHIIVAIDFQETAKFLEFKLKADFSSRYMFIYLTIPRKELRICRV